jgi:hypothetical protein
VRRTPAQWLGDPARTAPKIDARPAFTHGNPIEHHVDIARERRALDVQALDLAARRSIG